MAPFAPLFSERVFGHVRVLLAGAIIAPGKRTVSSALHAMGLDQHKSNSIVTIVECLEPVTGDGLEESADLLAVQGPDLGAPGLRGLHGGRVLREGRVPPGRGG